MRFSHGLRSTPLLAICALLAPVLLHAQTQPRDTSRASDTTRRVVLPRAAADTDSTHRAANILAIPGIDDLPIQVNLRTEAKGERDRNLSCNTVENAQINVLTGCRGGFIPGFDAKAAIKASGTIGRVNVNIDYDMQREFDASNSFSLSYQGGAGSRLQRVDVGNITFTPPPSRFMTPSLPSGNYGLQAVNQFGNLQVRSIFARQTGNVVQDRHYTMGARSQQPADREIEDRQIEPRRFFFTVDPALFGRAYPNIDILNRAQLTSLWSALPDTLRPSRVLVYRLQFGAQPQNANGPRFQMQGDSGGGAQTYDLLREGIDYYLDPSQLWIALVRPLVESNERLVVAYNVKLHGKDTVWTTTGGTPDDRLVRGRPQIANLIWEPGLDSAAPAFRREIRSVYRIAGEELVRSTTQVRIVTGSGQLEHPMAGADATFLQMLGLSQWTNPGEFDYNNRIWPRAGDAFAAGIGASDLRTLAGAGIAHVIRDQFLVFPSLRPFGERAGAAGGLVTTGNPVNELLYTTPGEYLFSPQHPPSVYRIHVKYATAIADEPGSLTLGATQMRAGSERVVLDKRVLTRDLDYKIDYDLGRIDFMRPDTLFREERQIDVRYEENPQFAPALTTFTGIVSELPVSHGVLNFTAINQSQGTAANRPQLGFQSSSSLTTGVSGQFNWTAPALSRLVGRLPFGNSKVESRISLQGEIASSHPQFGARGSGEAFVEGFDGAGGMSIPLADISWYYSSLPAYGNKLGSFGARFFEPNHAATLVWQTNASSPGGGKPIVYKLSQIDPLTALIGSGFEPNEPVLWLSLLPNSQAGRYNRATRKYDWTVANAVKAPQGQRFRSIRAVLSPAGIDLSRGEFLEFWTLIDTTAAGREKNGTLIFDFGDVSENSLAFSPETLTVRRNSNGTVDSLFTGKKLQGFDTLNTERDAFSHAFNHEVNDTGLPGDVADTLVVIDGASVRRETNAHICRGTLGELQVLGDPKANCTYGNFRLDEEDIDLDGALNFRDSQRDSERLLRFVVNLDQQNVYKRLGGTVTDSVLVNGSFQSRTRRWALISIPFTLPTESLNAVNRRRLRAVRLTLVSGRLQGDDEPMQLPLAQLRVTGAPWLNRSTVALAGIAGVRADGGFVITSAIGTNDSSATLVYQPPPGVINAADLKNAQFGSMRIPINERSMRIQAGNLQLYDRAEAYFRFPSGPQFYQGFQQLRVWGRGRGNGWGPNGDLQMFVKVGRDENNFYLYRAPMNSGSTPAAWTDLPIDFSRFINLRKKIQAEYLAGKKASLTCTGVDSAIIAKSPLPVGIESHRFAACDDGYMVYTVDPAVTAPNLAAVQELAVGFIRVGASGGASSILPSDTLELWVDDVRLAHPVNASGVASQVSFGMNAADLGDLHVNVGNRDPQFRQIGEQPTFLSERDVNVVGTLNLDRMLPSGLGFALPLTINKVSLANDPLYLSQTDIPGAGIPGLRKPRNEVTTYSLTIHRTAPLNAGPLGALVNNLSATTTYVSGLDRTEYQDGNARNFSFALDYLVADDSARTVGMPSWTSGALGGGLFRWNPTQFRVTSGLIRSTDRRTSFIKPGAATDDPPSVTSALSRLWRNGSVLEFRPTNAISARWEVQSVRDLRDYGDTTALTAVASRQRQNLLGANAGFERERSMTTSLSWQPGFSSWLRPRADIGSQYNMLRDPNDRSLIPLPGVIGVDSVLATRDSLALASSLTLPRRLTASQTSSVGTSIDIARAFSLHSSDSTLRRIGSLFSPIDVSYMRSLLTALDASPVNAPLSLQLGLGGPAAFRSVSGVAATTAGQTGVLSASGSLQLPFGASLVNRFSRTTTANWIERMDASPARVDGSQRQFPDVALRWSYRPASLLTGVVSTVDASAGFARSDATVSLPSLANDEPAEIRHTNVRAFPMSGSIAWAGRGRLSTGAAFSLTRRIDSLPGSVARTNGSDLKLDAGRVFYIPASWQLGIHDDLRTRFSYQQTHNITSVFDENGGVRARLQDNGRQAFTLTADSNINEFVVLTLNGSHIVTFDNNLNRRFAYTVFSTVFEVRFFGAGK